jgi:sarcosine/dimethylglycine N-methyltransferase
MKTSWDYNNNLYEEIIYFIKQKGLDPSDPLNLCHFDQIHAGGIKATEQLSKLIDFYSNGYLLDIGGGIGGVARYLSIKNYHYIVSLDYSWKYSSTGKKLTDLCKIKNIDFINGNALFLPFKDSCFKHILLQHVNMNIANKYQLFKECRRVIKKDGYFIFHEWFIKDNSYINDVNYPLPWADLKEHSFLTTFNNFNEIANEAGFKNTLLINETESSLKFYEKIIKEKLFSNPIFKGREPEKIFQNTVDALIHNKMEVFSGVFKPV